MADAAQVEEAILRPMQAVFSAPPNTPDPGLALGEYAKLLMPYSVEVLRAAWPKVVGSHTKSFWPPPGVILQAVREAAAEQSDGGTHRPHGENAREIADRLRELARQKFLTACRRHIRDIPPIAEHGYGAWFYSILAAEAWVCAQKDCEIAWPQKRVDEIMAMKRGPFVPVMANADVQPFTLPPACLGLFSGQASTRSGAA